MEKYAFDRKMINSFKKLEKEMKLEEERKKLQKQKLKEDFSLLVKSLIFVIVVAGLLFFISPGLFVIVFLIVAMLVLISVVDKIIKAIL